MTTRIMHPYLLKRSPYFDDKKLTEIEEYLQCASSETLEKVNSLKLRDTTIILLVSILLGNLGIDRFLIGDKKIGILKFIILGMIGSNLYIFSPFILDNQIAGLLGGVGLFITFFTVIDWFLIQEATRKANYEKIIKVLKTN